MISEEKGYNKEPFGKLITFFSLTLFYKMMRSQRFQINLKDEEKIEELSSRMDPLINQLIIFLNSNDSKLMQASLNIITIIINWPLRSLKKKNKKILRTILKVKYFLKNFIIIFLFSKLLNILKQLSNYLDYWKN